jgi:ribosomal protein S18 acetylase RimI-like enzyme
MSNSGQITIEDYRPEHFQAIQGFVEIIQDTESGLVPGLKSGAEIKKWYAQDLIDSIESKQGVILVALAEAEAIGFVCAWVENDDKLVLDSVRKCAYISDVCVSSSWRGHGVARQLLDAIEKAMQKLGCQRIRLCAKRGNLAAIKCYEGQGYQTYETILAKRL